MNPLLIQMIGGLLGDSSPIPSDNYNPDDLKSKPYKDPDFLTKAFHPSIATQAGQYNNLSYNTRLESEAQAQAWKNNIYDNSPYLKDKYGDNWRAARAAYGAFSQINPSSTNPVDIADTFSKLGGPKLTGQNEYEGLRNTYRKTVASGLLGNPEAAANAENSGLRLENERAISGLTNETRRAYSEKLRTDNDINRSLNIEPAALNLEKERIGSEREALPVEHNLRMGRGLLGGSLTGQEIEDLPYTRNTMKNSAILGSALSRYGGTKPIGGYSVNDDNSVGYGVNKGAVSPAMMQMQSLIANPLGFSGSDKVSGVKLPDGSALPMKEPKYDAISGRTIDQNQQPKKAMNSVTTDPSSSIENEMAKTIPSNIKTPSIASAKHDSDPLSFMDKWPTNTKKAFMKAYVEIMKQRNLENKGDTSDLFKYIGAPIGAALKTPFNY